MQTTLKPSLADSLRSACTRCIASRFFPLWCAAAAIVLTASSLWGGFFIDDYHHKLLFQGSDSEIKLLESPWDLFSFFDGDPQRTRALRDAGFVPWWTDVRIKVRFWRPLASMTHGLDYRLWPNRPALMHAHSVLWYGLLVFLVATLYRRLLPSALAAAVAALLFAVDDAHGSPVGFLSNRNAILSACFGLCAILAHDRVRRDHWRWGRWAGPACLGASLLSAEAGIATMGYLLAYGVFADRGSWRARALSLAPYVLVVLVWRVGWNVSGYGVEQVGLYVDPVHEPGRFAAALLTRAPVLLLGQLATPPADLGVVMTQAQRGIHGLIAVLFIILAGGLITPLLRHSRTARFWATGMGLALIPACAVFPSDRNLVFVGVGGMALVAEVLSEQLSRRNRRPAQGGLRRMGTRILVIGIVLIHGVLAPIGLAYRARYPFLSDHLHAMVTFDEPLDPGLEQQDLVIVNPPVALLALSSLLVWESGHHPIPRHTRVLCSSLFRSTRIHRESSRTLVVRPEAGFSRWILDRLFRSETAALAVGDRIELSTMTVEIREVSPDGYPLEAAFEFPVGLEDPSLRWWRWKDGTFVPLVPPSIGESVVLEPFSSHSLR